MDKRGEATTSVYFMIIHLVILAIVTVTLIYFISSKASNEDLNNAYLARDIAVSIDAVYSSSGDIKVGIPIKEDYVISIGNGEVVIGSKEGFVQGYKYGSSAFINQPTVSFVNPKRLIFVKEGNNFNVMGEDNE